MGLVPFGFTRACAERIALHLVDDTESEIYAAWYWRSDPTHRVEGRAVYRGPTPDGIVVWTSRRVLVIDLAFTLGQYWIGEARLARAYPTGESLPITVRRGTAYDAATIHGETLWFAHGCVPHHFD